MTRDDIHLLYEGLAVYSKEYGFGYIQGQKMNDNFWRIQFSDDTHTLHINNFELAPILFDSAEDHPDNCNCEVCRFWK